jgi:predicted PurR-regulated permease PerM
MDRTPPPDRDVAYHLRIIKTVLIWHLVLGVGVILYFARDLFLPLFLAFLMALTLRPVVRSAARRGIPPPVSAFLLALLLGATGFAAAYFGSGPATNALRELPEMVTELRSRLDGVGGSMKEIQEVSEQVEEFAQGEDAEKPEVQLSQPSILRSAATGAMSLAANTLVALVLAVLILGTGDLFHYKLVQSFDSFSDKKRALHAAHEVERKISRYLFTITIINAGLGLCVGVAFYLLGMPNAWMYGAMAFLLNFLPYIGALIGIVISAGFALLEYATVGQALMVPLVYMVLTSIEGQFVTPIFVGRQLLLNAVSVFITVVIWAWIWGVAGALMAVPFLVLVKVIADAVPGLRVLSNFLSGRGESLVTAGVEAVTDDGGGDDVPAE